MHEILFYKDADKGNIPVLDYIQDLAGKKSKDSRIKLNKILEYIRVLRAYGKSAGEPYIKHINGEIWELRPLRDRIFFAAWVDGGFVLLHHFVKKTQKTPAREIEKAKKELKNIEERGTRWVKTAENSKTIHILVQVGTR